jgi:hypothetical protein
MPEGNGVPKISEIPNALNASSAPKCLNLENRNNDLGRRFSQILADRGFNLSGFQQEIIVSFEEGEKTLAFRRRLWFD